MDKKQEFLGRGGLFLATLIWGTSFVVMKNALDDVPVLTMLAMRFCGAAIIMLLVSARALKGLTKPVIISGVVMGSLLYLCYVLQTYGLKYTTPGKNAFLTAVYCVIVPFLNWAVRHRRPDRFNIIAAFVCITGVGLISLSGGMTLQLGDGLTLLGGVCFSFQILATDFSVEKHSPLLLSLVQMATAGILALISALIFDPKPLSVPYGAILPVAYLSVMCTAVCFFLQTFGQKRTSPAAASVIMTFESVFGALLSLILGEDEVRFNLITGFILIFAAVIISETKLGFLKRKNLIRQ